MSLIIQSLYCFVSINGLQVGCLREPGPPILNPLSAMQEPMSDHAFFCYTLIPDADVLSLLSESRIKIFRLESFIHRALLFLGPFGQAH